MEPDETGGVAMVKHEQDHPTVWSLLGYGLLLLVLGLMGVIAWRVLAWGAFAVSWGFAFGIGVFLGVVYASCLVAYGELWREWYRKRR